MIKNILYDKDDWIIFFTKMRPFLCFKNMSYDEQKTHILKHWDGPKKYPCKVIYKPTYDLEPFSELWAFEFIYKDDIEKLLKEFEENK